MFNIIKLKGNEATQTELVLIHFKINSIGFAYNSFTKRLYLVSRKMFYLER